jgi:hypothetical protein
MATTAFSSGGTINGTTITASTQFTGPGTGLTVVPTSALTGQVAITNGGTGQATANAGFKALSPMTTEGDMIYYSTNTPSRLAVGAANTFMTSNGSDPQYAALNVGTGLSGNGVGTPLIIATSGVTASTYGAPQITVNSQGQITSASNIVTTKGDLLTYGTAGTRLPVGSTGQLLVPVSGATPGLAWLTSAFPLVNVGLTATVGSNALTITLVQANGSSGLLTSSPATVAFRNTPATSGGATVVAVTSATSITIPSGTTIGTSNSYNGYIYVYALNNSGTVALGVSLAPQPMDALVSSTAIGGGASATTLYSTPALTGVPIQYVGKIVAPQTTAGTWATPPTEVFVSTGNDYTAGQIVTARGDLLTVGSSNVPSRLAIGASNSLLVTANGTDPSWAALSVGTGLSGNGVGSSLAIATTGVTAATYGAPQIAVNAQGQITSANNILTTAGDLLYYNGGVTRLPVGSTGNVLTVAGGVPTWAAPATGGTVTSVALALPTTFSVSGSPVTSSGTLTATYASQTANQVFAAPNGSSGTPTFRALVNADLPASGATAGTYTNASYVVNSAGVITGVTSGGGTVSVDGTTISGNGSSSNVLKALVPYSSTGTSAVSTTDATQTRIYAVGLYNATGVYAIQYTISAAQNGGSGAAFFQNVTSYLNNNDTYSQMGSTVSLVKLPSNTSWSVSDQLYNTSFAQILVTGQANTSITWTLKFCIY